MGPNGKTRDTRELGVTGTSYIVVYRIDGATVVIANLLHAAQLYPPDTP
ncbi:type II toxin-antitoxin system RelE/ParE family toxin [Rhizobium sp. G21]|nr:type II toxin-antitoxin system RelE/ParE family toxin [Rhizobium sp. G21]